MWDIIILTKEKKRKLLKTGGRSNEIINFNWTNSIEREVIQWNFKKFIKRAIWFVKKDQIALKNLQKKFRCIFCK